MTIPHEREPARRGRPSSRDAILDAARALVSEVGAARMTLDAVAERAGVSKGGLLYNFPSKDALLQGMIQRFVDETAEREAQFRENMPDTPNRPFRAFVRARLDCNLVDRHSANSLVAAAAANPRMLDPVRAANKAVADRIRKESPSPDFDRILWLAAEGLAFFELMGVTPFDESERRQIIQDILTHAERSRPE